jgi:O-antigen/teichoic acid export membrane protein
MTDDAGALERAGKRVRRVTATAAASALAALVQLGVGLLVVPLSLAYLGSEQYGLWMTVTSLTAMLAFADFGMGNGLLNAIASADGSDDGDRAAAATSSAVFLLTALGIVLALLFWISYPVVGWERLLNATKPALAPQARHIVAVTIMCAIASLPLGVSQRVQMGYQEGFLNGAWNAAGSLLGLAALVFAISRHATLPWLVLCLSGAPVVGLAANGLALFGWRRPRLRPRWCNVSARTMRHLLGAGSLFFAIQLAGAVGYQLPVLAIARLLGPADVTNFAVPLRLFMVVPALMGFFLTPLWPAYREALARGDAHWVKHTVGVSVALCLALNVAWGVALVFSGPAILRWWVGSRVVAPIGVRIGLAMWGALTGLGGPFAMFLNAAGALKFQAGCAWAMAAASVVLAVVLIPVFGVTGAAFAMVLAQGVCILAPSLFYVPRLLRGMTVEPGAYPASSRA